nr:Tn3 family transposase [Escherichia coli]
MPLAVATDCEQYLHERLTLLEAQLATVNRMAAANDLPDAIITESGLKITPLDAAVPDTAQALIDQTAMVLPHVKITELLLEVDEWTGFTRHFTHLKSGDLAKDKNLLLTRSADAINSGPDQDGRVLPRHDLREARLAASLAYPRRNVLDSVG